MAFRAHNKIPKVVRIIADFDAVEGIRTEPVTEAIQYPSLDRNLWARTTWFGPERVVAVEPYLCA